MHGVHISLEELLALRYKAQQLHLSPKVTLHAQHGGYQSAFRGRGMDFVETRIYQPGDDIRNINWAVTARTGKPHTKLYQQERERPIYLIIDFNASMYFGTRNAFKSVMAARAAAILAWAGLKNGERVGGLLLKDCFKIIPLCHRKQNLMEFFKHLVSYTSPSKYAPIDYQAAFTKLKKNLKAGGLIYFISDFYSLTEQIENELMTLARHHQLINILVYDPIEKNLPPNGQFLFHDHVDSESLLLDTSYSRLRNKYEVIFENRVKRLKKLCFATGISMFGLCTDDDIVKVLRQVSGGKRQ
jgi:uncharacterized protein (DUF58 family)